MGDPIIDIRPQRTTWPWATIAVLSVTALLTAAQFVFPTLLPAFARQPDALRRHQYWRLITPLFFHSDGWKQIAVNFPAIALIGYFTERVYGPRTWLLCYFLSGFAAELFAYAWQPTGAGASIAGAGLLGALALAVLRRSHAPQPKIGAVAILVGAAILCVIRNIHGPPVFVGAGIGLIALRHAGHQPPQPNQRSG